MSERDIEGYDFKVGRLHPPSLFSLQASPTLCGCPVSLRFLIPITIEPTEIPSMTSPFIWAPTSLSFNVDDRIQGKGKNKLDKVPT